MLLPPTLPLLMFLAVWLVYAADRLLDIRTQGLELDLPDGPHRFYHDHRRVISAVSIVLTAIVAVLLPSLPAVLLGRYLILATLLFAWLLVVHFTSLTPRKAFAPGIFFAAAVFLPMLGRAPVVAFPDPSEPLPLLVPALCFAALCTLNCLLIQHWERHSRPAAAPPLRALALVLAFAPLLLQSPVTHAISLSASALLLLTAHRTRLHHLTLRAAADLTLLSPLVIQLLQVLPSLK